MRFPFAMAAASLPAPARPYFVEAFRNMRVAPSYSQIDKIAADAIARACRRN